MTLKNLGSKHGDAIWVGHLLCRREAVSPFFFFSGGWC